MVSEVLTTSPPITFRVTLAEASASGHHLLLAGVSDEVRTVAAGHGLGVLCQLWGCTAQTAAPELRPAERVANVRLLSLP